MSLAGSNQAPDGLPPGLEERLTALEQGQEAGADFDAHSWRWILLLGAAVPAALLLVGWCGA